MADLRYLESREKFLGYAWSVFSSYFESPAAFEEQFDWIQEDKSKNLFLKIASFYKFLVRDGTFVIELDGEVQDDQTFDETYKFIAIIALIEALYEQERYVDFFEWLSMRERRKDVFPIDDLSTLDRFYRDYKAEYGATKKTEKFFEALDPKTKSIIESAITVGGEYKPAEVLAKLLYGIRSEFVHRAELVLELTAGTLISVRGEQVIVSDFSLRDLKTVFEQGLLQHFNFVPYKK